VRMRSIHCLFGAKRLTTSGLNRCPSGTPHPHIIFFKDRMKYLKSISYLLVTIWRFTFQCLRTIAGIITSLRIYSWLSFIAAVLGFVGTFVIVMDKFEPIHRGIDRFQKWQNISIALKDLDAFDTEVKDGKKLGMVELGKQGFSELVDIIISNRPDMMNKDIVAVAKNQPMALGGVPFKIVHVAFANNPQTDSLTTEYVFYEWVRDYREKYFLKMGLLLIGFGFLVGVLGHIKRKTNVNT
jgi:hypothetical protein